MGSELATCHVTTAGPRITLPGLSSLRRSPGTGTDGNGNAVSKLKRPRSRSRSSRQVSAFGRELVTGPLLVLGCCCCSPRQLHFCWCHGLVACTFAGEFTVRYQPVSCAPWSPPNTPTQHLRPPTTLPTSPPAASGTAATVCFALAVCDEPATPEDSSSIPAIHSPFRSFGPSLPMAH